MRFFLCVAAALMLAATQPSQAQDAPAPAPTAQPAIMAGTGTYDDPYVAADNETTNDIFATWWTDDDQYPTQPRKKWHDGFWWYY